MALLQQNEIKPLSLKTAEKKMKTNLSYHPPTYQTQCSLNTKSVSTVISGQLVEEGTLAIPILYKIEGLLKTGPFTR